jgi:hypothetical protein
MIKYIMVGVWVCALTIVSSYFAMNWKASQPLASAPEKLMGGAESVRTKMISVPIVADGAIQGYVVAQFVFVMDSQLLKRMSVPPEVFLLDEAFSAIYTGGAIDFRNPDKRDLQAMAKTILEKVNGRLGGHYVDDVLIQELNFVPKEEARASPVTPKERRGRRGTTSPPTEH